jgi:hypothetical protein
MIFEKKKKVAGLTTGFETAVVGYSVASAGDTPANGPGWHPSLPSPHRGAPLLLHFAHPISSPRALYRFFLSRGSNVVSETAAAEAQADRRRAPVHGRRMLL